MELEFLVAGRLDDLRVPPGNHLEALIDDRAGQHSIRVDRRYRLCFRWTAAGAADVEIVDDHWPRSSRWSVTFAPAHAGCL